MNLLRHARVFHAASLEGDAFHAKGAAEIGNGNGPVDLSRSADARLSLGLGGFADHLHVGVEHATASTDTDVFLPAPYTSYLGAPLYPAAFRSSPASIT